MMADKRTRIAALLLGAVLVAGCEGTVTTTFCAVPPDEAPMEGGEDADVTLVEFGDFECPYCANLSETLRILLTRYPHRLQIVYRHLPLSGHEHARAAAIAAICAGEQGEFWELHDLLFANQGALSEEDLRGYAESLELDMEAWDACQSSDRPRERLNRDEAAAIEAGVYAVPTTYVNGSPVVGAKPLDEFEAIVDRAIERQESSGLEGDEYYQSLIDVGCY